MLHTGPLSLAFNAIMPLKLGLGHSTCVWMHGCLSGRPQTVSYFIITVNTGIPQGFVLNYIVHL